LGRFTGTFDAFFARYGQRPDSFYLFNLEKGWILPRKLQDNSISKKNQRNFRHGGSGTPEYFAYQYLRRGGYTSSFQEFIRVYGVRPGPGYRFVGNKGWSKRGMKPVWNFLTSDEILKLYKEIHRVCDRGDYDYDEAVAIFFTDLNLEGADEPYGRALRWIRRYLAKTMSARPKFVSLTALGESGAEYNQELID
jgi:hypothetical protein